MKLSNKFKNNQNLIISVLLVLGIVAAVNILADQLWWRADLTADKIYSTAPVTKEAIKSLPDPVNVRIYFSSDLPNQFNLIKRQLDDLLSDYSSYGNKLSYQFVDPGDGKEAEALGIPKLQFNDIRHDKLEVVTGYMGMVINYRDKQEVIPVIQDLAGFEYSFVSLLKKMSADKQLTVGFLANYSTVNLDKDLQILRRELAKLYDIESVDLTKPVADNIQTLVIAGVKTDLKEEELKNIDKFLMSNRSLIVLHDGASTITTPVNFNVENKSNLAGLLAKYGLVVKNNLVADVYSGVASFSQGVTNYNVSYPLWPKLLKDNFDQSNASVANLEGVILPWASSIVIDETKVAEGASLIELAKSSDQAWLVPANTNINPAEKLRPTEERGAVLMAASLSGKLKSAYAQGESQASQLVVVGDSDFIRDDFVRGAVSNLVFMQNIIDGATLDADLAQIKSKELVLRPIKNLDERAKQWFSWFNILGMTVLVVMAGLVRYYLRKKSRTLELKCYE